MRKPVKFYDKNKEEISQERWCSLIRDEEYTTIEKTFLTNGIVTTKWIGTEMTNKKQRGIFSTTIVDYDGSVETKLFQNFDEAIKAHLSIVKQYEETI